MASPTNFSEGFSSYVYISKIQKASQIPEYCTRLANLLARQPLFTGSGSEGKPCKLLPLLYRYDARICDIFNKNARSILGEKTSWPISNFGEANDEWFDANHCRIAGGVILYLHNEQARCPLPVLKESYKQVLQAMRSGWQEKRIEDYPDIACKENSDDFALFVKTSSLIQEEVLIRFITSRINMQDHVKCSNTWLPPPHGYSRRHDNQIYLWVRKATLDDIVDKFGFQLKKNEDTCVVS